MAGITQQNKGQALVEYAIVFPVLILMVLGIFEFGRIIYSYNAISNAAREGTRYAVVPDHQDEIEDVTDQPCPGTNLIVKRVCERALLPGGSLSVTVNQLDAVGKTDPDIVHVEVEYTGDFVIYWMLQLVNPSEQVLRAAATMRLE